MRKYTLASTQGRRVIDLRDYQQEIETAVLDVMPTAKVTVY